jgi:hypothetical protein
MHPAAGRFGATLVLALSTAPTRALVAPRVYYATHIREVRAARLCMALGYEPSFEDSFLEEQLPGVPDGFLEEPTPRLEDDGLTEQQQQVPDAPFHHALGQSNVKFAQDAEELLATETAWRVSGHLWVLLFGSGQGEGIYTLKHPRDSEFFVLAFEEPEEASRFAMQLEAEDFELPRAEPWPGELLCEFCSSTGLSLGLVLGGELVMPPSKNQFAPVEDLPASFHVKTLERIFNMEEITSPEVHRQLSRMYAMRRPRMEEDTAVNWPVTAATRDSSDDVH